MHYLNYNVLHLMPSRVFARIAMDYPVSITNVKFTAEIATTKITKRNKNHRVNRNQQRYRFEVHTSNGTDKRADSTKKRANKQTEMTANLLLLVYTTRII